MDDLYARRIPLLKQMVSDSLRCLFLSVEDIANYCVEYNTLLYGVKSGLLFLYDDIKENFSIKGSSGFNEDFVKSVMFDSDEPLIQYLKRKKVIVARGNIGSAFTLGIEKDDKIIKFLESIGIKVLVPLFDNGNLTGIFCFGEDFSKRNYGGERAIRTLKEISRNTAKFLRERIPELKRVDDNASAFGTKPAHKAHAKRVTRYAFEIWKRAREKMNVPIEPFELFLYASCLLHHIEEPSKFFMVEREFKGFSVTYCEFERISAKELFHERTRCIVDNLKYQHEHYDGSGPYGLKGEEIPLVSRLIAIANALDETIYDQRKSPEGAVSSIKSEYGKKFDPHLCEALEGAHRDGSIILLDYD